MIRSRVIIISLFSTAMLLFTLLYYFFPAGEHSFYPGCFSYEFFGIFCPSCGAQRSVSALLHGEFLLALKHNLLLPFFLLLFAYASFFYSWNSFSNNKKRLLPFRFAAAPWIVLTIIICYTILRNIPAHPFSLMAP